MYQINMLYTLNIHNVTCQLYLNKNISKQTSKQRLWGAVRKIPEIHLPGFQKTSDKMKQLTKD